MDDKVKKLLAVGSMVFVFTILSALIFVEIPVNNIDIFNTTFGMIIGGSITLSYTYYFGDSDKVGGDKENKG